MSEEDTHVTPESLTGCPLDSSPVGAELLLGYQVRMKADSLAGPAAEKAQFACYHERIKDLSYHVITCKNKP